MAMIWQVRPSTLGVPLRPTALRRTLTALALCAAVLFAAAPPSAAQTCAGDCNGNGVVSNDETLVGANVALGTLALKACPSADANGDGRVGVGEAVGAVGRSMAGCGGARTTSAGEPRAASPQIELGVVAGSAGAQVSFDATLHTMGNDVAGTENEIAFDPLTPIISCQSNPAINKSAFAAFSPIGCTPGVDCTSVKLLVLSLSNVDPIPDGSVLYSCTVAISIAAPDGTYPLDSFAEGAATPDGDALPLEGIDGAVIVAGALCAGDCNGSGGVTINDLIIAINILVGGTDLAVCPAADIDGDGLVAVYESVAATGNAHDGCGSHPSGPPGVNAVAVQLGVVAGTAGTQVSFDATLHTNGESVAGTQNDIAFDPQTPIGVNVSGRPACTANPAINKNATVFAFLPNSCTPGLDCTGVRALVSSFENFDPIPDGSILYTCIVDISLSAADGSHPLVASFTKASTPGGQPIPAFGIDGAVTTTGGMFPPTPTPTPVGDTTIVVGSASGVPGQLTTFGVGLETSGEIAGVQNDLTLGNTAPIVFSACEVNPDINKDQTIFGFQPLGCMPDINCSGVRALVLSFSNLDPIPDGSTMYSCDVLILPAAAPGEYPIECSNEGVADPDGMALPVDCSDGAITVLAEGPPVAPASLILQKARLGSRSGSGGSVLLRGVVNTNPPFGSLDADIAASGLSIELTGAGGVDFTLSWDAAECTSRQTARGPKIRCDVDDASGKQRIVLRPMRIPNLLRMKVKGTRLSLFGPFTADPVTATLVTSSFQRPDTIDNCALRRSGALTSCKESGVVP
jgi:hypothetical protein